MKCKARLVVRGDQQINRTEDLYAATLAIRSFRLLMSIVARFDLEIIQFDITNASVYAGIDEEVYMWMPTGYKKPGMVLRIKKALYGLKQSPLLWQRLFQKTLQDMGFVVIPHEPCCLSYKDILIFFYVDDIAIAYRASSESMVKEIIRNLKARFSVTGGSDLKWFLGIEVIRDRERHLIWLSQSSYVQKSQFRLKRHQKQARHEHSYGNR